MNAFDELAALRATHACTLELLAEVSDYLLRLPPIPVTRDLCRKIDSHLADPQAATIHDAARRASTRNLSGGVYTPQGTALLLADFSGCRLSLRTGIPKSREGEAHAIRTLLALLRESIAIELKPPAGLSV